MVNNFLFHIYQVTWKLIDKLPQSRIGRLHKCRTEEEILELADGYDPHNNEYFFHRQPRNFNCVLNFLQNGKLHLGEETCVIAFSQVMLFSGILKSYENYSFNRFLKIVVLLGAPYYCVNTTKKPSNIDFCSPEHGIISKIDS